jgi:ADP-heptose:LPS heptosyltransferase
LISIQKGHGLDQLSDLPSGMMVENSDAEFDIGRDAFIDTAAIMSCLDLIVTSDTSIAHLAGALGRPVWVGLKDVPEWRWMLDRSDSPWYPTMKLYRQTVRDDWNGVFERVADDVAKLAAATQPGSVSGY